MTFKTFDGTSAKGDFEEALSDAVRNAAMSIGVADALVNWKLREVAGENGGIAGLSKLTVTIEVGVISD